MGTIINFPEARRVERELANLAAGRETATIMILPVVRIERSEDGPPDLVPTRGNDAAGRKRRRRARRS